MEQSTKILKLRKKKTDLHLLNYYCSIPMSNTLPCKETFLLYEDFNSHVYIEYPGKSSGAISLAKRKYCYNCDFEIRAILAAV